ncbi:MAG: hypothetical protein U9N36_06760 [Euryarchaeota archaeon]|nr:hypothetical protein [Euryarchaeota archaeon]
MEIDIVAFCDCKWQNRETGVGVLKDLLDKSRYVRWNNGMRVERFMVVSKSGFTRKAVGYAMTHNIILLTPEEIWKIVT